MLPIVKALLPRWMSPVPNLPSVVIHTGRTVNGSTVPHLVELVPDLDWSTALVLMAASLPTLNVIPLPCLRPRRTAPYVRARNGHGKSDRGVTAQLLAAPVTNPVASTADRQSEATYRSRNVLELRPLIPSNALSTPHAMLGPPDHGELASMAPGHAMYTAWALMEPSMNLAIHVLDHRLPTLVRAHKVESLY